MKRKIRQTYLKQRFAQRTKKETKPLARKKVAQCFPNDVLAATHMGGDLASREPHRWRDGKGQMRLWGKILSLSPNKPCVLAPFTGKSFVCSLAYVLFRFCYWDVRYSEIGRSNHRSLWTVLENSSNFFPYYLIKNSIKMRTLTNTHALAFRSAVK